MRTHTNPEFRFYCTGKGTHKPRELAVLTCFPKGGVLMGEPVWDEMSLQVERAHAGVVRGNRQHVDMIDFPEGRFWRFRCANCQPRMFADSEIEAAWNQFRHADSGAVDISTL